MSSRTEMTNGQRVELLARAARVTCARMTSAQLAEIHVQALHGSIEQACALRPRSAGSRKPPVFFSHYRGRSSAPGRRSWLSTRPATTDGDPSRPLPPPPSQITLSRTCPVSASSAGASSAGLISEYERVA